MSSAELPPGWVKRFSRSQQRDYFFHVDSGKSVWKLEDLPNLQKLIDAENDIIRKEEELIAQMKAKTKKSERQSEEIKNEDTVQPQAPGSSKRNCVETDHGKSSRAKTCEEVDKNVKKKQRTPAQDRRYRQLYEDMDRRAKEKAANFLRDFARAGNTVEANKRAVEGMCF